MKKILLILMLLLTGFSGFSQKNTKDTLSINQIYQDVGSYLILEKVIVFDSTMNQKEVMNGFENWAGETFRDYENVKTSKTENQITLTYISDLQGETKMYVNLIVEFRENRMRIRFYDDGNSYVPAVYSGTTKISNAVQSRTFHLKSYFGTNDEIVYNTTANFFNVKEKTVTMLVSFHSKLTATAYEIESYIKSYKGTNNTTKSDW